MLGYKFLMFPLLLTAALWGGWLHCPTFAADYRGAPKIIDARGKGVSRDAQNGIAFANFKAHKFSYLDMTSLVTVYVLSGRECGLACVNIPSCFSFNLAASYDITERILCELLPSDKYNNSNKFIPSKFFHHFSIKSPCMSGPCLNNGTCVSLYSKNSYACLCSQGYNGTNCEKDIDECTEGTHTCSKIGGLCKNTKGSFNCSCKPGFSGDGHNCLAENCSELYKFGERSSGVYTINPDGSGAFDVFCDQTTAGGGWTVFQKRQDGSVDFYLGWADYKHGFGNVDGEFWLGMVNITRLLSSGKYKLRVDLEDSAGNPSYAEYGLFEIGGEETKYQLTVGSYSGTAGDHLAYHNGRPFSTNDQDNDWSSANCAVDTQGAWWYSDCRDSSLNGLYNSDGAFCIQWGSEICPAKRAEMKIRPVDF